MVWARAPRFSSARSYSVSSPSFSLAAAGRSRRRERSTTPEAGVAALIDAARKNDQAALESILGPGSRDVISSGDAVADAAGREDFLAAYDAKSNLVAVNDDTRTLQIGETDWPLPIPLVREDSMWHFDLAAGRDELINRRIGRNELNAIEAALAFVDAQQDYASADRDGDMILEYAPAFHQHAWHEGRPLLAGAGGRRRESSGPEFAEARAEGYQLEGAAPGSPYYGYRYKILTSQGPAAMGGAYDYVVNGNMLAGVGLRRRIRLSTASRALRASSSITMASSIRTIWDWRPRWSPRR